MTPAQEQVQAFLGHLRFNRVSESTLRQYSPVLREFSEWAGDREPSSITAMNMEQFLMVWEDRFTEKNGRRPKDNTRRNVRVPLDGFYRYLSDYGLMGGNPNPMKALKRVTVEDAKDIEWLEPEHDTQLLRTAMKPDEKALIWFLRWTGLRIAEALNLTWRDISDTHVHVTKSKTKNGIRDVLIADLLRPHLSEWKRVQQERGRYSPDSYVFQASTGKPWTTQQAERTVKRVGERAEIGHLYPHKLRATFGSSLLNNGLDMQTVSRLMGHANETITAKYYAKLMQSTIDSRFDAVVNA